MEAQFVTKANAELLWLRPQRHATKTWGLDHRGAVVFNLG